MTEYQALLNAGATHAEAIEQLRIANQPIGLSMAAAKTAESVRSDRSVTANRVPPTLKESTNGQLGTAALRHCGTAALRTSITLEELAVLEAHIGKFE